MGQFVVITRRNDTLLQISGSVGTYINTKGVNLSLLQSGTIFFTKWDSFCYYKVGQLLLLQSGTAFVIAKWDDFFTKWDVFSLLQSGTAFVIAKWDDFIREWDGHYKVGRFYYKVGRFYYKEGQVLQSGL